MNDKTFTEWLQSEAKYCADRISYATAVSKKQYWIGRQQAYENAMDKYKQLNKRIKQ